MGRMVRETGTTYETILRERVSELLPGVDPGAMMFLFNLSRAGRRVARDMEAHVHAPLGLTSAGFRILQAVLVCGPLEPSRLSTYSDVTRPTIASVLNTLERDGLIVREHRSRDRRVVSIKLTERGADLARRTLREQLRRATTWAAALSADEMGALGDVHRRLLAYDPDAVATHT
jgi:DNA-binding MarR family transcriptional regulator